VTVNSSAGPSPDFTVALFYRPPSSSRAVLDTFWKTIRLLYHDYSSIPTLLDGDGSTTVESSSVKAACLNNFFYTCFNYNYPLLTVVAQDLASHMVPSVQVTALLSFFVQRSQS